MSVLAIIYAVSMIVCLVPNAGLVGAYHDLSCDVRPELKGDDGWWAMWRFLAFCGLAATVLLTALIWLQSRKLRQRTDRLLRSS